MLKLYVDNDIILETEHGQEGDEINKILNNKNYGWQKFLMELFIRMAIKKPIKKS